MKDLETVYRYVYLKLVPDSEPNAEGKWRGFKIEAYKNLKTWKIATEEMKDKIPNGYHFVSYRLGWFPRSPSSRMNFG